MTLRPALKLLKMGSAALIVLGLMAPQASASFPPTADRIRNWEPEFMASTGHSYSRSAAVAQAREFDVIMAGAGAFRNHVAAMKAANPDLVLLVYVNGGYSTNDDGTKHPSDWYAHDASGRQIISLQFGNRLMNPRKWNWIDAVGDRCVSQLSSSHYDGCFLDSLGPAALQPGYVSGLPINPSTGQLWLRSAWMNATANLARKVKARIGSKILVPNGIQLGREYFDPAGPTSVLATGVDGAMVELFVRPPYVAPTQYRSLTDWQKDVDMLVNAGANGRVLLCVTKAWSNGTTAQENALHEFALASFLLGTNGKSYFSFLYDKNTARSSSYWDADLGSAAGGYFRSGGVYRRNYGKGIVLVNPTATAVTVTLTGSFKRLSGQVVTSSVWLGPHTGAVLTRL